MVHRYRRYRRRAFTKRVACFVCEPASAGGCLAFSRSTNTYFISKRLIQYTRGFDFFSIKQLSTLQNISPMYMLRGKKKAIIFGEPVHMSNICGNRILHRISQKFFPISLFGPFHVLFRFQSLKKNILDI